MLTVLPKSVTKQPDELDELDFKELNADMITADMNYLTVAWFVTLMIIHKTCMWGSRGAADKSEYVCLTDPKHGYVYWKIVEFLCVAVAQGEMEVPGLKSTPPTGRSSSSASTGIAPGSEVANATEAYKAALTKITPELADNEKENIDQHLFAEKPGAFS